MNMMTNIDENNQIIIYQGKDGETCIDVKFTGDTVWLSQQQMAELYQTTRPNIVQHIGNIYEEGELDKETTCKKFLQVGELSPVEEAYLETIKELNVKVKGKDDKSI